MLRGGGGPFSLRVKVPPSPLKLPPSSPKRALPVGPLLIAARLALWLNQYSCFCSTFPRTSAYPDPSVPSMQPLHPLSCLLHVLSAPMGRRTPKAWCRTCPGAPSRNREPMRGRGCRGPGAAQAPAPCRLAAQATRPGAGQRPSIGRLAVALRLPSHPGQGLPYGTVPFVPHRRPQKRRARRNGRALKGDALTWD